MVGLSLGQADAKTSKAFIEDGIQGDTSEIMIGKLAGQNGSSAGVKQFGETLVDDHSKAKNEKIAVAQKIGATVPAGASKEAQKEIDKLSKMSGADFDREFVMHMTMDHQKDVKEFEEEAKAGHAETSNLAMMQLPTLQKHLQIAQSLGKSAAAR
jgi:putative membrane protein